MQFFCIHSLKYDNRILLNNYKMRICIRCFQRNTITIAIATTYLRWILYHVVSNIHDFCKIFFFLQSSNFCNENGTMQKFSSKSWMNCCIASKKFLSETYNHICLMRPSSTRTQVVIVQVSVHDNPSVHRPSQRLRQPKRCYGKFTQVLHAHIS